MEKYIKDFVDVIRNGAMDNTYKWHGQGRWLNTAALMMLLTLFILMS